jgi:hypothetical protein
MVIRWDYGTRQDGNLCAYFYAGDHPQGRIIGYLELTPAQAQSFHRSVILNKRGLPRAYWNEFAWPNI